MFPEQEMAKLGELILPPKPVESEGSGNPRLWPQAFQPLDQGHARQ
jgi:hypothetical protein